MASENQVQPQDIIVNASSEHIRVSLSAIEFEWFHPHTS